MALNSLIKMGLMRRGQEVTGEPPSGSQMPNGIRAKEQRGVFNLGKTPAENTIQLFDGQKDPLRAMHIESNRYQMRKQGGLGVYERRALIGSQTLILRRYPNL